MIYETILHRGQRRFFQLPWVKNDLANEIVMQVFHWCHPKVCGDFSCRGPSTWEVYMRQGSNPYSLAHSGGPSAEALDFFRTSSPPKKSTHMMFFFGGERWWFSSWKLSSWGLGSMLMCFFIDLLVGWGLEASCCCQFQQTCGETWGSLPHAARLAGRYDLWLHGGSLRFA